MRTRAPPLRLFPYVVLYHRRYFMFQSLTAHLRWFLLLLPRPCSASVPSQACCLLHHQPPMFLCALPAPWPAPPSACRARPAEGRVVPLRRHRPAPAGVGQRDLAARARPPSAGHRGGVHPGRLAWPTCRHSHLPGQGLDRGQRRGARCGLGRGLPYRRFVLVGGAVLRVAGGVFYGLGDPPAEDPEMAREASEEKSETDEGKQRTPLTMIVPPAILSCRDRSLPLRCSPRF